MEPLVCPDCGNESVTATLTTRTKYDYSVLAGYGLHETGEECVDGGDLGDADSFECTDCGRSFCSPETEMVTREQYDEDKES